MNFFNNITVTDIVEVPTIYSVKNSKNQIFRRTSFGILFCQDGKIVYKHDGKEFVADKNCAVFLPQNVTYEFNRAKTGYFYLINFLCNGISPKTLSVIKIKNSDAYIKEFKKLQAFTLLKNNRSAALSCFYDILAHLNNEQKNEYDILTPALEHIKNHYSDPTINNKLLSEKCSISEVYFRRIFKSSLGTSPHQYIIDVRIAQAKLLLLEPGTTISEISEQTGFSSVYHFSRIFKDKTGCTPTQFIKQNIKQMT